MKALAIHVGQTRVGLLEQLDDWEHRFSFDDAWLEMPDRPILGQLFEDRLPHDILTSGLPCWFSHLLPQGPLRRALERQLGNEDADDFDLLQMLGDDLPGAVIARPAEPSLRPLAPRAAAAGTSPPDSVGPLRFSLAGAQWKLSVRQGERGLVLPVRGQSGRFIAKFHDPQYPGLPRIEHTTMEWARLTGLNVPPFRLVKASTFIDLPQEVPVGDGDVFLIQRFDRKDPDGRVQMEDFGQVLDRPAGEAQYRGRYEHIGAVIAALAPTDVRQFCERVAFCAVSGNGDAHLKNWTLLYRDNRHACLSPAYDLVATVLYPEVDARLALDLASSRKFEDVTERSFEPLALVTGFEVAEVTAWVREASQRARQIFLQQGPGWPLTKEERLRLESHLARVPLGR
jgi:serine/threonine-protein kinase HipA